MPIQTTLTPAQDYEAFLAMARSLHRDLSLDIGIAYFGALVMCDPNLAAEMQGEYPDPSEKEDRVPEFLIQVYRRWKDERQDSK